MTVSKQSVRLWWQDRVFYQIYPLSFSDSDGDGYGDLDGVRSHLRYLSDTLGVDGIWLSPFFKSPMKDWGYDVAVHTDVDPLFGDLAAAEALINEAHELDLKVLLDYIPNHSSDQSPWFIESRSSRDDPKRDWYVWRDPGPDGGPPNNWVSVFSGPAWTLDESTGQYYRHTYLSSQPDLNWRDQELVEAMSNVARFWLDRGVDGFRIDAAHQMMKDPDERDNPPVPHDYERPWKDMGEYDAHVHLYDYGHPDVHGVYREFRALLDSYPHRPMSVGEVHIFDLPEWATYYGESMDEMHMPFNFHLMASAFDAETLRVTIEKVFWNVPSGGWTNWTLGNHDEVRLATRLGAENARLAAMLLLTLRGTPFLYYGDELGMSEVEIPAEVGRDPWGKSVAYLSRDGARTPMQWEPTSDAGFGAEKPWLPFSPDKDMVNVATELGVESSMLSLYRRLLKFRRGSEALRSGSYLSRTADNPNVLVYRREGDSERITVALNLSDGWASAQVGRGKIQISTVDHKRSDEIAAEVELAPREGVIILNR